MDANNRISLILSLIKKDLINSKFIDGLADMGIDADNYSLYLIEDVLKVMEFEKRMSEYEDLFDYYLKLTDKVKDIDIFQPNALDGLSMEIYLELSKYKDLVQIG